MQTLVPYVRPSESPALCREPSNLLVASPPGDSDVPYTRESRHSCCRFGSQVSVMNRDRGKRGHLKDTILNSHSFHIYPAVSSRWTKSRQGKCLDNFPSPWRAGDPRPRKLHPPSQAACQWSPDLLGRSGAASQREVPGSSFKASWELLSNSFPFITYNSVIKLLDKQLSNYFQTHITHVNSGASCLQ